MSDTIWAAIISGALGIGGTILGIFIGGTMSRRTSETAIVASNKNAVDIMQKENFNRTSAKLRAAFAPAQARIKLAGGDNLHVVCNIINELTPAHAAAIEEFRPFVPISDRDAYQKAWEDCYQTAMQGAPYAAGQAFKQEITIIEFFDKKIHNILAFTEK